MTTPDHDAASPAPTLPELRDRIDALDRELIAMLNRRARLAQEVGEIKKREGSVVFRPEREAQVIDGLTPNGQLPQGGDMLTQGLDMLKKGGLFG